MVSLNKCAGEEGWFCCPYCEHTSRERRAHECPAAKKVRGPGDMVARLTKLLGIKKCRRCCRTQKALNGG